MSRLSCLIIFAALCLTAPKALQTALPLSATFGLAAVVQADSQPGNFIDPSTDSPMPLWTTEKVVCAVILTLLFSALGTAYWRHACVLRLNRKLRHTLDQLELSRESLLQSEANSRSLAQEADRAREHTQTILESIQDGISIQDREFRVLYQNQRFIEMVGVHTGEYCYRAYKRKEAVCRECPLEATFLDSQPHASVMTINGKGGRLHIEVLCSPLRDEHGEVVAAVECVRDITARIKMEETLHEQTKLLEQEIMVRQCAQESLAAKQRELEEFNDLLANRVEEAVAELRNKDQMLIQQNRLAAMGEMINYIAHQWRQPLNNIGLIVQNIEASSECGELTVDELEREVGTVMQLIMHMSQTINDFSNFFRQDKEKETFFVNEVVNRSLELIVATLGKHHISVETSSEEPVTAFGYQNEYAQVLLNIIANARDVLAEKRAADGHITIRVASENGRTLVTIRDNGGGIAEDILPRIFDPYFTTKEPGKGTGIGLYMSKVIIEQNMGGRLTAANVEGGAEFRIEV